MDAKKYWVGFNHVKGIGAVRFQRLLDVFSNAENAWNASELVLQQSGIGEKTLKHLIEFRRGTDLDSLYEEILAKGIEVITIDDCNYPENLRKITTLPPSSM